MLRLSACVRNSAPLLAFLCGCSSGPRLVEANGQLLYKQQPLSVAPNAGISIWFIRLDAGAAPATFAAAPLNRDDATFTVPGRDGRGIPVGKYRIAIRQMMLGDVPADVEQMNDLFSRQSSGIERDVTGSEPIILDLSKPGG